MHSDVRMYICYLQQCILTLIPNVHPKPRVLYTSCLTCPLHSMFVKATKDTSNSHAGPSFIFISLHGPKTYSSQGPVFYDHQCPKGFAQHCDRQYNATKPLRASVHLSAPSVETMTPVHCSNTPNPLIKPDLSRHPSHGMP